MPPARRRGVRIGSGGATEDEASSVLSNSAATTLAATALTIHLLEHAEAYANLVHVWPDVKLALRVGVGQVLVHHRPQMILRLL